MTRAGIAAFVPVAVGVFAEGGYGPDGRVWFGAAALVAGAVALAAGHGRDLLREPVVLVLLALAVLGTLSALWTLGPVDRTLRWALVCAGYAGVAVAAGAVARRRGGVEVLAGAVAVLAIVAGIAGLVAAVAFEPPYAERIGGVWRPGGPFEYPPALALLEVSALPVLLAAAAGRSSRGHAGFGAVGLVVAGGVLALSASRVSLAMAVAVGGVAVAGAGASRARVVAGLALAAAGGIVLQLVAGAPAGIGAAVEPERVVTLVAVLVVAAPLWLLARPLLDRARAPRFHVRPVAATAAVIVVAVLAGSLAFGASAGRGVGAAAGFLHGRDSTWGAAVETFGDRPLSGAGADAFLAGSARHQDGETIAFAHSLPLELAAELGAPGLMLAISLYLTTASLLWRVRATMAGRLLGPAAAAFLVANLVDWPWHLAGSGAVWAAAVGALAGARPRAKKLQSANQNQGDS